MLEPNKNCPDCKGFGKILLLNKTVDCDCIKNVNNNIVLPEDYGSEVDLSALKKTLNDINGGWPII